MWQSVIISKVNVSNVIYKIHCLEFSANVTIDYKKKKILFIYSYVLSRATNFGRQQMPIFN
jgi:hypothetical protein